MSGLESQIQQGAVAWFRYQYPHLAKLLVHIPNEGKRTVRWIKGRPVCTGGAKLKAEGMVKGAADLVLFVPNTRYHALCLETKVETYDYRGGKETKSRTYQSPEQKEWQALVEGQGYKYEVYRTIDEFRSIVIAYLNMNTIPQHYNK